MSEIYIKTGDGLIFELPLPRGEKRKALAGALEEIFRGPEETMPRRIIETIKELFPVICREPLERITDTDARKLGAGILSEAQKEPPETFSDEIIQAALCYKWTLEYAASLPREVLLRCLEIAAGKRAVPPEAASEELRQAVARGAEAMRKFQEQ